MNLSQYKTTALAVCLFMAALLPCHIAKAQSNMPPTGFNTGSGWAAMIQVGYDIPLDALSMNYRLTPTYGIGVAKQLGNFTVNANINHHAYPPKKSSYLANDDKFVMLGFFVGGAYDKYLSPVFKVYGGLNVGGWYKRYSTLWKLMTIAAAHSAKIIFTLHPRPLYLFNQQPHRHWFRSTLQPVRNRL